MSETKWITPFKKQCFVTLGVSLNTSGHGLVMGFAAVLLPQLKRPDSIIPIDDASGSWIPAILGFALVTGNFLVPTLMAKFGRKIANLVSISPMIIGWLWVVVTESFVTLLIARFLQGVSMGMSASLGSALIGEYTSPENRGAFLTTISLSMALGVLFVHTLGSFLSWKSTALICACLAFVDLLIVVYSPESPYWLAEQGRFDESKKVFRWLRGDSEDEEMKQMIEASILVTKTKAEYESQNLKQKINRNINYLTSTIKKKEFYKPIFIMIHLYCMVQWGGGNILAAYTGDVFQNVIGENVNIALLIITLGVQRIISNTGAIFVIKKFKRRTILFTTIGINIAAYYSTAVYMYLKSQGLLPFDHPLFGVFLVYIHMFSIATGAVPLPFIIAGELFPLEYRSLAGAISVLFLSVFFFLNVKSFHILINTVGLCGAYCLYGVVMSYCLLIAWKFLPETKDRTLQDIADEFRGKPLTDTEKCEPLEALTQSIKRTCSSPLII